MSDSEGRVTPERIAELRAKVEAMSPFPLGVTHGMYKSYLFTLEGGEPGTYDPVFGVGVQQLHPSDGRDTNADNNLEGLAALRNEAPALLDAAESLIRLREWLAKELPPGSAAAQMHGCTCLGFSRWDGAWTGDAAIQMDCPMHAGMREALRLETREEV